METPDPHARQKRYRQRIKAKADSARIMEAALRTIAIAGLSAIGAREVAQQALATATETQSEKTL